MEPDGVRQGAPPWCSDVPVTHPHLWRLHVTREVNTLVLTLHRHQSQPEVRLSWNSKRFQSLFHSFSTYFCYIFLSWEYTHWYIKFIRADLQNTNIYTVYIYIIILFFYRIHLIYIVRVYIPSAKSPTSQSLRSCFPLFGSRLQLLQYSKMRDPLFTCIQTDQYPANNSKSRREVGSWAFDLPSEYQFVCPSPNAIWL